jgi:23S rRNA (cytidine1920-2'-O)/16S rRNA (cytidine1409-2'-O)-methyltransferase
MERTNARHLTAGALPEPLDWVVIDASFIGLGKLLPAAHALLRPGGELVALIKPQFEVGKGAVGKRGVVRDEGARAQAIARILAEAGALGFAWMADAEAVIAGPEGNREHFAWVRRL